MAITEALRLVVDADTRGAVQGIEHLGRTADRELSRSEKSLDRWGNRLTNIGASLVGFGSVALVGLGAAAMASEEANLATVKLENTLRNMPKLAGESSQQFIDLADSIQDVTAADADAIVEAQALLGTFQLTAQEIKGITPLVVDYARKFGVDIPDAAVQVGKALDGQSGALKRNGVSINEALFATDRYAAVTQALRDQVGGFAEAEGATFAGSVQRLKNELGDLAEGVGTGAVDAFSSMFGVVEGLTGRLNDLSPAAQNTIGQVATFGSVGVIAAGGLSILIGQTLKAVDNFKAAGEAIATLSSKIGGFSGVAQGLAVIGPLALVAGAALQSYSETKAEATRIADKFTEALQKEADGVKGATAAALAAELTAGDLGSKLRESSADLEVFDEAIRRSGDGLERLDDLAETAGGAFELKDALRDAGLAGSDFADELLRVTENMSRGEIIDLVERLDGLSDRYGEATEQARNTKFAEGELAAQHGESAAAIDGVTESTEEAASALEEYNTQLRAQFDPLFGAVTASQQLADANAKVAEAELNLAAATRDHGAGSLEAMAAQDALTRAEVDAASAALGQEAALVTLSDAVANGTVSLQGAKQKLQEWVAQGLITQASADVTAAKFDEVTGAANAIPSTVSTTVFANTHSARLDIAGVGQALNDIDGRTADVTVRVTATGQQALRLIEQKLLGFATGGVVPGPKGSPQLVVAHGGETFIPTHDPGAMREFMPQSFPAPAGGMGGGGGGSYTYAPTYQIHGSDPQAVIEAIKRYERSNGPGWRN